METEFIKGVQYALECLKEVFGEEVTETDIWKEFFGDKGVQE